MVINQNKRGWKGESMDAPKVSDSHTESCFAVWVCFCWLTLSQKHSYLLRHTYLLHVILFSPSGCSSCWQFNRSLHKMGVIYWTFFYCYFCLSEPRFIQISQVFADGRTESSPELLTRYLFLTLQPVFCPPPCLSAQWAARPGWCFCCV